MRLLISDANILIDLEDAELTALLFRLPFRVMAPDLLFFDELAAEHPHLIGLGLELGEVKPAAIAETQVLAARYRRPSRNDCLALALAKQEHCPLATGDRDLAEAARAEAVPVVVRSGSSEIKREGENWMHREIYLDLSPEMHSPTITHLARPHAARRPKHPVYTTHE